MNRIITIITFTIAVLSTNASALATNELSMDSFEAKSPLPQAELVIGWTRTVGCGRRCG